MAAWAAWEAEGCPQESKVKLVPADARLRARKETRPKPQVRLVLKEAPQSQARYEVRAAKGRWMPYDDEVSALISREQEAGQETCTFSRDKFEYVVDLINLTQKNVATGSERPMRLMSARTAWGAKDWGSKDRRSSWWQSSGWSERQEAQRPDNRPPPRPEQGARQDSALAAWVQKAAHDCAGDGDELGGDSHLRDPGRGPALGTHTELFRKDSLHGADYGLCTYMILQAFSPGQESDKPVVVLWLHGADMSEIPRANLCTIQSRLRRRVFFVVPMSPKVHQDGRRFNWGLSFTKAQNKNVQGFIFGELCKPFLDDLTRLVKELAAEVSAQRVLGFGYSMGGFGIYQLAEHDPKLFDVGVVIAGYGQGTLEPENVGYRAPQPKSRQIFEAYLDRATKRLAQVPALIVIHAEKDVESSFIDIEAIVKRVHREGGNVDFVVVPEEFAESDRRAKRSRQTNHRYFGYALLEDTSEEVLYKRIDSALLKSEQAKIERQCCST